MATVTIDGRTYRGSSVSIMGGKVTIDGVVQDGTLSGIVEIKITEGTLGELRTDASVSCKDVAGSVNAGGSINCGKVGLSVSAGGSVNCGDVGGSVTAGGSIIRR